MNWRWIRALGDEYAAPYEVAAHPLGRPAVFAHELYSIRIRSGVAQRGLPPPGKGVLILESDLLGSLVAHDGARPFTPVVLVDGEPVATGFGRADIDLEPGRHLLQVQTGASGAYRPVDIGPGAFTRVSSFVPQRLATDGADGDVRAFLKQFIMVPTVVVPPRLDRRFVFFAPLVGMAAGLFSTAAVDDFIEPGRLLGLLIAALLMAAGAVACYWLARLVESAVVSLAEARLSARLPVARYDETGFSGGAWRPVDPCDGRAPASLAGWSALRLEVAYVQRPDSSVVVPGQVVDERGTRKAAERRRLVGEDYPPQARPWVEGPIVSIDGEPVPAIWGVNEYRLRPGAHRVEVAVPPPPEVLVGEGSVVDVERASIAVDPVLRDGQALTISAMASIEAATGFDGWELSRYSAALTVSLPSRPEPFSRGQTVASTEPTSSSGPTSEAVRATVKSSRASRLMPPRLWATAA